MTENKEKITCGICGAKVHAIQIHLKKDHPEVTLGQYQAQFPDAPILSELARSKVEAAARARAMPAKIVVAKRTTKAFHEVFGLGSVKEAMNARGGPIPVTILGENKEFADLVPDPDPNYVFNVAFLKDVMMGYELGIPTYVWGHMGTGKSSLHKQICALTNRPHLRVQHTFNTEESHIIGQKIVKDGEVVFELGPLPIAMKYGLTYVADEYDFAMPSVLSVYQPVLEGEPLVIKEADPENRVIFPHPDFRIVATGNTNGTGDETGLYQGTNIGNAANYERFGIVGQAEYLPKPQEKKVVALQGAIPEEDAAELVEFATEIRKAYAAGKIGMTISPRALIRAAQIGSRRSDYRVGLQLAFSNRLSTVDREVADQCAQRILG